MASTINAQPGTSSLATALVKTADTSGVLSIQTNGTNALTIGTDQNVTMNSTGAITVPVGTTAQRPASPVVGMLRYNTTIPQLECYINSSWLAVP
jgi:hypothetical protein